jgi:predicted ATPase
MHLEMLADITAELLTNRDVHASDYFTAHEEIFAFRRAASRLKEMQTVAYAS